MAIYRAPQDSVQAFWVSGTIRSNFVEEANFLGLKRAHLNEVAQLAKASKILIGMGRRSHHELSLFQNWTKVLEIVQILPTSQVAAWLPRFGCKISVLLSTTLLHLLSFPMIWTCTTGIWNNLSCAIPFRWRSLSWSQHTFPSGHPARSTSSQALAIQPWSPCPSEDLYLDRVFYVCQEMWFWNKLKYGFVDLKGIELFKIIKNYCMDSNLQRRFSMWLPCPPPSYSARCVFIIHF